ncbi:hypothetical protein ABZ894_13515 [Nocardia beijingensis]|uniref:hypothetical protein n=1 Tax=Nocardia beijingensis TaxID=95162 RepID=UPI0033E8093C
MLESRIGAPPTNRTAFAEFIAAARARARGLAAPRAALAAQSTIALGGHYWLSSAHWTMSIGAAPALDLYSDFLVRRADGELRIAAYLTRQDLPRLVRDGSGAH